MRGTVTTLPYRHSLVPADLPFIAIFQANRGNFTAIGQGLPQDPERLMGRLDDQLPAESGLGGDLYLWSVAIEAVAGAIPRP